MTRRRWIADHIAGGRAYLTGQNAAHLARVLRAKPGQQFDIAAEGVVRSGTIVSITSEQVEFELGEPVQSAPLPEISVVLAIFKFDRMEWAIEKLTELGAATVFPVISRRTEPHLAKAVVETQPLWLWHEHALQMLTPQLSLWSAWHETHAASAGIQPPAKEISLNLWAEESFARISAE